MGCRRKVCCGKRRYRRCWLIRKQRRPLPRPGRCDLACAAFYQSIRFLIRGRCSALAGVDPAFPSVLPCAIRMSLGWDPLRVHWPVPVRVTFWGEPEALSTTDKAAVNADFAVGLNSSEMVQLAPVASEAPQVVPDLRKEVAPVPDSVSELKVSVAVPEFLTVTT